MDFDIREGLRYTSVKTVDKPDTAIHYMSGNLEVLATPAMIALMENAAMMSVKQHMPEYLDTVGIEISVEHTRASAIGAKVEAIAILTKIEGRRLYFLIRATDELGEIGQGKHVRCIVDKQKFMSKLNK